MRKLTLVLTFIVLMLIVLVYRMSNTRQSGPASAIKPVEVSGAKQQTVEATAGIYQFHNVEHWDIISKNTTLRQCKFRGRKICHQQPAWPCPGKEVLNGNY